jgi:hypothetical protein
MLLWRHREERARNSNTSLSWAHVLSKSLMLGLTYPYDWGFIPSTLADDGDPLDVMIMHEASTSPGLILRCNVIGALLIVRSDKNKKTRNDRLLAVPTHSHLERHLKSARGLPRLAMSWKISLPPRTNCRTRNSNLKGGLVRMRLLKEAEKRFSKHVKCLRDGCPRSNLVRMVRTIVSR